MKKLMREHGFMIITSIIIIAIFATGFIVGRYGKAAPSLEIAENGAPKVEASSVVIETTTSEVEQVQAITVKATAYCPCEKCCEGWAAVRPLDANGNPIVYTASGTVAMQGRTLAVDPDVFPYGTEIIIDGRTYVAEDKGGAINGNAIDIFFNNHDEARAFGVQELTVFVNE
jgi:3D (Asp-Asp-Asp) domain-containing protein